MEFAHSGMRGVEAASAFTSRWTEAVSRFQMAARGSTKSRKAARRSLKDLAREINAIEIDWRAVVDSVKAVA